MCQDSFNELAQPLPFAHCSQSRLVCAISGLPLNEHNLPMMLPNGYVYGEQVRFIATEMERCAPSECISFLNVYLASLQVSCSLMAYAFSFVANWDY